MLSKLDISAGELLVGLATISNFLVFILSGVKDYSKVHVGIMLFVNIGMIVLGIIWMRKDKASIYWILAALGLVFAIPNLLYCF